MLGLGVGLGRGGEGLDLHAAVDDGALDHGQGAGDQAAADLGLFLQCGAAGDLDVAVDLAGAQQLLGADVAGDLGILADGDGAGGLDVAVEGAADELQTAGGDVALDGGAQGDGAGGDDLALEGAGDLDVAVGAQGALQRRARGQIAGGLLLYHGLHRRLRRRGMYRLGLCRGLLFPAGGQHLVVLTAYPEQLEHSPLHFIARSSTPPIVCFVFIV